MKTTPRKFIGRDSLRLKRAPITGKAIVILFTMGIVLLPSDWLGGLFVSDPRDAALLGGALLRLVGVVALALFAAEIGIGPRLRCAPRALLVVAPFLLVAINNLPILALASGRATVTASAGSIVLFALWCVAVSALEETAFRGMVLPFALTVLRGRRGRTLWAVVLSSALFGLMHLVNLASASVGAVALQVGYSFLVGALCAVATLYTGSLVPAVVFHAVYNFGGLLVPTIGAGQLWDIPTVIITAVLAVAVAAYVVVVLRRVPDENVALLCGDPPPPSDI